MARAFLFWNPIPYASNGTIRGGFNTFNDAAPDNVGLITVMVIHSRGSYAVRGFTDVPYEDLMFFVDHEAPLNESIRIEVWIDGIPSTGSHVLTVASDSPLISDPIRGGAVPVTIQSWPERSYERAGKTLNVSDSKWPVIIGGFERAASSTITLIHNQNPTSASALNDLLAAGSTLRVRPSCPWMEAAWVSARDRRRRKFSGREDSALVDTIELLHMAMPQPGQLAIGATLLDLHQAVPGTLADIDARWDQLRHIFAEDLTV